MTVSYPPTCHIGSKPVNLMTAKADEAGRTVHETCYFIRVSLARAAPTVNNSGTK
jgi:hypothetical protein